MKENFNVDKISITWTLLLGMAIFLFTVSCCWGNWLQVSSIRMKVTVCILPRCILRLEERHQEKFDTQQRLQPWSQRGCFPCQGKQGFPCLTTYSCCLLTVLCEALGRDFHGRLGELPLYRQGEHNSKMDMAPYFTLSSKLHRGGKHPILYSAALNIA